MNAASGNLEGRDERTALDESLLAGRGLNYYQVLEVDSSASSREIREAYRKIVPYARLKRLEQGTSAYYRYLREALDTLTNDVLRQAYDESLGNVEFSARKRFVPSSVVMPNLGKSPQELLPQEDVRVLPRGVGKILGGLFSVAALAGLAVSAFAIPASGSTFISGSWLILVTVAALFFHFHPIVRSPIVSRSWVLYALVMFTFGITLFGEVEEETALGLVLVGGILTAGGLIGVAEWFRSSKFKAGENAAFPLSAEFILDHHELGTAGESWKVLSRQGRVPRASLTKETFTQQVTADILMRLTSGSGVRLINGLDVGAFVPHALVAGNKVAVIEGIIVESNQQSLTSRGVITADDNKVDDALLSIVPAAIPLMEALRRNLNVRGWVLLIPRNGGVVRVAYRGDDSGKVRMGEAEIVLNEIADFFKQDKSYNVLDLRVINSLWSRKKAE